MKNLLLFIIRHHYIFLFIILESVCFYLLINNNIYQKGAVIISSNKIAGRTYELSNDIKEYLNLKETNKILAAENSKLRALVIDSVKLNDSLTIKIDDSLYQQQYRYVPAKVINNTTRRQKNYITINKGSQDSIHPGMGVISSNGLVGVIKNVSNHYASIVSFLHLDFEVSARIKQNNYAGTLKWDGKHSNKAILKDISTYAKLSIGDTIETTGYSALFPEGIALGTVNNIKKTKGENFYHIEVLLLHDFNSLSHVYVIQNFLKKEQKELEASNEK